MKTCKIKLLAIILATIIYPEYINSQELSLSHLATRTLEAEIAEHLNGTDISSIKKMVITGESLNSTDATYLRTTFKSSLEELDISGISFTDGILSDKLCQQMTALTRVSLPDNLMTIGKYAFQNCINLSEIKWKSVSDIDDYAFANCSKLNIMSLPENITRIGQYGFSKCSNVCITQLPISLVGFGVRVFEFCSKVTVKEISPSITEVKERLFDRTGITEFTLSDNVTKIGNLGFYTENNPIRAFYCRREVAPILGTTVFGAAKNLSNTTIYIPKKYATSYSIWESAGLKVDYLTKDISIGITGSEIGTVTASGAGLVTENPEVTDGSVIKAYEGEEVIIKVPQNAIVKLDHSIIAPDTKDNTLYRILIGSKNLALDIDLSVISNTTENKEKKLHVTLTNGFLSVIGEICTPIYILDIAGNQIIKTTHNSINMNEYSHGVYVMRVNNKSFKFVK